MSDVPPTLYCATHPQTPTTLRCSRCEKLICPKCAVRTPTGYRCKECVKGQQKIFDTARWHDYVLAFIIAGVFAFLGSLIIQRIGFITILVAPIIGAVIGEIIRFTVHRRRSKKLSRTAAGGALVGSLPYLLLSLLGMLGLIYLGQASTYSVLGLVWQGFYTFAVISTVFYRV